MMSGEWEGRRGDGNDGVVGGNDVGGVEMTGVVCGL